MARLNFTTRTMLNFDKAVTVCTLGLPGRRTQISKFVTPLSITNGLPDCGGCTAGDQVSEGQTTGSAPADDDGGDDDGESDLEPPRERPRRAQKAAPLTIAPTAQTTPELIGTNGFAALNLVRPQTIRKRLCNTGSYFGVYPVKLASGRLAWPSVRAEL